ncbi:hypothetical protein FOA52_006498 [Chlamydomonas sp. UWO 241]|nr:hypothetical protein FOA52_006498 [Chlamydomonas sp. UWO 241]
MFMPKAMLSFAALLLVLSAAVVASAPIPISSVSVAPTNLATINCSTTDRYACDNATWVYCIDAQCDAPDPVTKVANCYCWTQVAGKSQGPPAQGGGAQCTIANTTGVTPAIVGGAVMCDSMRSGELWSTLGYLSVNTSFLSPFVANECPTFTPFTYCWGAKCRADPNPAHPNGTICECPWVTMPNPVNI